MKDKSKHRSKLTSATMPSYKIGACGHQCKNLDQELLPKYKCKLCGVQLHNAEMLDCSVIFGNDGKVACHPNNDGCVVTPSTLYQAQNHQHLASLSSPDTPQQSSSSSSPSSAAPAVRTIFSFLISPSKASAAPSKINGHRRRQEMNDRKYQYIETITIQLTTCDF